MVRGNSKMQFAQTAATTDPISLTLESDRESTKSDSEDPTPTKKQNMFIWNKQYEKWHECSVEIYPTSLQIVEYEDQKLEVNENQLMHLTQSWYHGALSRKEARVILQDFNGGSGSFLVRASESYQGKFAISFVHESNVKHVVIESKRDPVAGILYNITPHGPVFNSLYELIQEAQKTALIQNHSFNVQLTCSPPKPDMSWLHGGVKSLSQAEQILRKEHRDGSFFVYKTQSEYAPYIVAYRSNGSILHNLIVYSSNQPNAGYTLNHVTSQVLYKVIHYFMENPINEKTVLRYAVPDRNSVVTNCGIALKDWLGDREMNELRFTYGALVTNVKEKTKDWMLGDHRGDKQKYFKRSHIRFLTKDELAFVNDLRRVHSRQVHSETLLDCEREEEASVDCSHTLNLCLRDNYKVEVETDQNRSTMIVIEPTHPSLHDHRTYKLSCSSTEDLESWYCSIKAACALGDSKHDKSSSSSRTWCTIS